MDILLVGLSHKTAPVEIREHFAFGSHDLEAVLLGLVQLEEVREAVVVSTCNRTEIYAVGSSLASGRDALIDFVGEFKGLDREEFEKYLYYSSGVDLSRHLFRVVSGLDSMVLGETEILGQVRDAYMAAQDHDTAGKYLHELFSRALSVGKRAHSETEISANAVSVSYAAVELAKKVFDRLEGRRALVIGAGEMSQLTAKHLQANGVREIIVANRTVERAEALAKTYGGRAIAMADIKDALADVDVVISSTGAPHAIIDRQRVQTVLRGRKGRPLFLVDIAVPRDIEPQVGQLNGVFLYDIDDLESVVESNLRARRREAKRVQEIVAEEADAFSRWIQAQDVVPVIRSLRKKAGQIQKREVEKALAMLPDLSKKERKIVSGLANSIVNKILANPTIQLRKAADSEQALAIASAATYLFDLEVEEQPDDAQVEKSSNQNTAKKESPVKFSEGRPQLILQDRT